MNVKDKLEALLQIERTDTIQKVFRSFYERDLEELYETVAKYFELVLKVHSEVRASQGTMKFYLEKQMREVMSSLLDYCNRIKVARNFSGVSVTFGFERFRAEVDFDFSSCEALISSEDLQKMHELTNSPCIDSVVMSFTEGGFFDKAASGLVEIEREWGRRRAFERFLESLLVRCEKLNSVRKQHEKYIAEQKKFKKTCRGMALKEEHNRMQKVAWEWLYRKEGEAKLENVFIGYFSFFRKIFLVQSSLREEDRISLNGCSVKINNELDAASEAFKKFSSDNEFFLHNAAIQPNFLADELSGYEINAGNVRNFFNHRVAHVSNHSPEYEFDVRNVARFVNGESRMKSMVPEVQRVSRKLTHGNSCKVCLSEAERELDLLNSKYDFENVRKQISRIVASEVELREAIESFDENYQALYFLNTSNVESFAYRNGQLEFPFCTICMKHFKVRKAVVKLHCGHTFHKKCFVTWMGEKRSRLEPPTCPICRENSFL